MGFMMGIFSVAVLISSISCLVMALVMGRRVMYDMRYTRAAAANFG